MQLKGKLKQQGIEVLSATVTAILYQPEAAGHYTV